MWAIYLSVLFPDPLLSQRDREREIRKKEKALGGGGFT